MARNNFFRRHKVAVIVSLVLVLAAAAGCGVWYYLAHSNADPVYVFPFQYVGMTEYWGDNQESYGPVTTDRLQTVYLTDTQTVVEVKVQTGDTVEIFGDLQSVNDLAAMAGTIPYELMCAVSRRIPRIYLDNGVAVERCSYL